MLEVQRVLDLCVKRRLAGEDLTDQQIVAEYSGLMPELGEELSNLRVIERARTLAREDVGPVKSTRTAASGEPHLLDFGLARATGMGMSQGVPVAVTGGFVGTLAYASPEQTRGDTDQVDIRTDVHSLGVILYEVLTGSYPYPVIGQMADVLRNIAEAEALLGAGNQPVGASLDHSARSKICTQL